MILPSGTISASVPAVRATGLFTTDGLHAAALNQDGTANSAANPAAAGSAIELFGSGAVWPASLQKDGMVVADAQPFDPSLNKFVATVNIEGTTPLNTLYVGAAPGIVAGVFQINVQLPPGFAPRPRPNDHDFQSG